MPQIESSEEERGMLSALFIKIMHCGEVLLEDELVDSTSVQSCKCRFDCW